MLKLFVTLKFAIFLAIIYSIRSTISVKILVVIPHRSFSHAKTFEPYFFKLSELGHHVTVVSYYSVGQAPKNYREIVVKEKSKGVRLSFLPIGDSNHNLLHGLNTMIIVGISFENVLENEAMRRLLNSDEKFDLFVTDAFMTRLFVPLGQKYDAPVIYLSSNILFPNNAINLGDYVNPAFVPTPLGGCSWKMDFFERLFHSINVLMNLIWFETADKWSTESIARKYFDLNGKSLKQIESEGSLVLVNGHFTLSGSRPLPPNVVDVGGINLMPEGILPLIFSVSEI